MKRDIWTQVKEMVDEGKCPEITLFEEQEIKPVKLGRGRPPNLPEEKYFRHYLGRAFRPDVVRPRCYRKGCNNQLRRDQPVACSDFCEQQIILEAEMILTVLKKKKIRLPISKRIKAQEAN